MLSMRSILDVKLVRLRFCHFFGINNVLTDSQISILFPILNHQIKIQFCTSLLLPLKHDFLHFFYFFRDVKVRRDAYIKRLNDIYFNNLKKSNVHLIRGQGSFVDKNKISVGDEVYSADHILVAVGGYPTWPQIPGAEHGISSDGFFELESLPKKAVVVGAGYIAVEMAGILKSLGSEVTQVIRKDKVLRSFDPMIVDAVTEELETMGIELLKNDEVVNVEKSPEGRYALTFS